MAGTYAALVAHVNPGEEVILFEPFFDQYFASIRFQGATPVYVPLHPPADSDGIKSGADWSIDFDELRAAFSDKTKAIIINTPHNPVGKVFTRQELEKIAELCKEFNVLCLADEVYDCMLYDGVEHVRMASIEGMWERTITIGSGGSMFFSVLVSHSYNLDRLDLTHTCGVAAMKGRCDAQTVKLRGTLIEQSRSLVPAGVSVRALSASPSKARLPPIDFTLLPFNSLSLCLQQSHLILTLRMAHRRAKAHLRHASRPLAPRLLHKLAAPRGRRHRARAVGRAQLLRGAARRVPREARHPVLVL